MQSPIVYFDGQFLPAPVARLSFHDVGFVWGATVTERVRTYRRQFFRLPEHLARFRTSCEICRVPQPVADSELTRLAEHLLEQNGARINPDRELVLIMFATPGERSPSLGLMLGPLDVARYQPFIESGARLITPAIRQIPPESLPPQAKIRSRMHWWIAEHQARDVDANAAAILLDADDCLTETATANFAIVRGGKIMTPPRSTVLDGISLRVVQELCGRLNISFLEQSISVNDCFAAEEALLTGTSFGVCGVASFNGRPIPWPGTVLGQLYAAWSDLVAVDIWRDFLRRG